ncbi:MAG: AsmA family protein [Candidatus Sphingomonas phytovorans]|nr:AsmA family protein [Sphingomonas sp.]WEJ99061.1 MAG: AsmA family protein [Sphingomonas sp.]
MDLPPETVRAEETASADAEERPVASESATEPPSTARRLSKPWRIARNIVLGIIGAIFIAWLILYITKGRFLKHPFERTIAAMTHRVVKVPGDFQLYFDPITIHFVAEGMTISNPAWASKPHLFEAKRIDTRIATFPLIFGNRRVRWLDMLDGAIDLEWSKDGRTNTWTFSEKKGKPFEMPLIRRATVAGTTLRYVDPKLKLSVDLAFQTIKASDTRFENSIQFTGKGVERTTPFTLYGAMLTPNATVTNGRNQLDLHIKAARTAIDVAGTLDAPTRIDGADLNVTARGANIADLFSIIGVAVPETRSYRLQSALTKTGDEYRFTGLHGRFGDSDIAGKLTVAIVEPRLKIDATLATRSLDIVDIAPFIGYNPDAVAAKGKGAVVKQINGTPRLLPDAPLRVEALRNFDATLHYTVRTVRARNLPVSNIDLTLGLDNSLLTLSPLAFDMARGHVTSDIRIDARRPVVHTDYDIRLSPTPMGVLLAGYGVDEAGTSGTVKARIRMAGDGNTVHESLSTANGRIAIIIPAGSFWTRNVQLAELDIGTFVQKMFQHKLKEPVRINCGLIAFTVRNGIAAADPILIDTQKNVIVGRGGFSFRNESLDFAVRADAKKFSLFSAQSPVGVNGYFAKSGISVISPELLTRAGIGIGAAVIASPIAGILAFVDIGDAKATQCGPVLSGATARAQRTTGGKPRDDVGHGTTAKAKNGKTTRGERTEQRKKFLGVF